MSIAEIILQYIVLFDIFFIDCILLNTIFSCTEKYIIQKYDILSVQNIRGEEAVMLSHILKKNNNEFLKNFDNEPFYDTKTEKFLMDFDREQKELLKEAMQNNIPVEVFAYTYIPAEFMDTLIAFYKRGYKISNKDVYKICHTDLTLIGLDSCLVALKNGIKMVEEIEKIHWVNEWTLYWVSVASEKNKNLCKMVRVYTTDEIKAEAQKTGFFQNLFPKKREPNQFD